MQHYDVRLKAILQKAMPRLLRLLGLPAEVAEYLTVEFALKDKALPDSVLRFADGRIVHFEVQSQNDRRMLWRCLDYYRVMAELWPGATGIDQIVLYLGQASANMKSEVSQDRLTFGFEIFRLQDVEASEFLESESDDERVLAVLCECKDPRERRRRVRCRLRLISRRMRCSSGARRRERRKGKPEGKPRRWFECWPGVLGLYRKVFERGLLQRISIRLTGGWTGWIRRRLTTYLQIRPCM